MKINIQQGAKLFTLGSILTAGTYKIPEFQRGYAWKNDSSNKQLEEFWQDFELIRSGCLHYGGSLMLEMGEGKVYVVIDGQQRLTTAIILLAVLRDQMKKCSAFEEVVKKIETLLRNEQQQFRLGYDENEASESYMKGIVYKDRSYLAGATLAPTLYSKNLEKAHAYFSEKVDRLTKDELLSLFDKLTTQFVLNVLIIDPSLDVHIAFETINNRGKKLSELELLKNRLLYLTTLMSKPIDGGVGSPATCPKSLRANINRTWKDVYGWLGKDKEGRTASDDEFLRTHGFTYFRFQKETNALHKTLFDETFSIATMKSNPSMAGLIQDYLESLQIAVVAWHHIHCPEALPSAHQLWLDRIGRLRWASFKPLVLAAYMRLGEETTNPLSNPRNGAETFTDMIPLLEQVERFIFMVYELSGKPSHTARNDFYRLAFDLAKGADKFMNKSSRDAIAFAARLVGSYNDNWAGDDKPWRHAKDEDKFERRGHFDLQEFHDMIRRRLERDTGYYRLHLTNVLLYEYEEKLRGNRGLDRKVPWEKAQQDSSVEHIFPQTTPQDQSGKSYKYWLAKKRFFLKEANEWEKSAEKRRNTLRHSLGNLLLVSIERNRDDLKNNTYPEKQDTYKKGSFSETTVANHYNDWNKKHILERGNDLLEFMSERWNISFDEWGVKKISCLTL